MARHQTVSMGRLWLGGALALLLSSSSAAQDTAPTPVPDNDHHGPYVAAGKSGPARFVGPLYAAFDKDRAMKDAAFVDGWYRTPGSAGYDASLDRIAQRLKAVGFGSDERLQLRILESEMKQHSWTPLSASLTLRTGGRATVLQAFSRPEDRDRTMLPRYAPSADITGRPVFDLDHVEKGTILVTSARASRSLVTRTMRAGASGILSSALFPFTVDPTGRERHRDAILYTKVSPGTKLPVAQISPRVHDAIDAAAKADPEAVLQLTVDVHRGSKKIRTLVAEIVGHDRGNEAVVVASHVQEPGAGDNASGVAGLAESVCTLVPLLKEETFPWPSRTIAFVWGDEKAQSRLWIERSERTAIAGISADMLGQSTAETGSIALLERSKDPGALVTLEPDSHTPWGAGEVSEEDMKPNGLALIARTAMADVATHVGTWPTSENPWEGGSDHDVFIDEGIPGVLFWHFTDFTYHTSLDRMEMLDAEELRRSCVVVLSIALAITNPIAGDIDRYLASNELERSLRLRAAAAAGEDEVAVHWRTWCDGAATWLEAICAPQ